MRATLLFPLASAVFLLLRVPATHGQIVIVQGRTYKLEGTDYKPLDGVLVEVFRTSPAGTDTSKDGGKYRVDVRAGDPFRVCFTAGMDRVPEINQLAGMAGLTNDNHVVLLTIGQYDAMRDRLGLPPLTERLQSKLRQVPGNSEAAKIIRQMLQQRQP